MDTATLRQRFLDYFARHGHKVVPSAPLVPGNDPTLLFTNAGMVPFKDVFLGRESRSYTRAASVQRCVRAGGKHNDLENVGYTARHHTFFEMLGNFSFGDYFKQEAIRLAWSFITEELGIPAERLWVTVYRDDDEAARIWLEEVGVDPGRFARLGEASNFWAMGDTGPCGPCSEIFYDHGESVAGGPPGSPDEDGDRYVEIWNLVFMQYDRSADGSLAPLPAPSVDTGMGLERIAAVMQGVHSNYEIDLFRSLTEAAARVTGCADRYASSLRVIADHIRSAAFLVTDGVLPGNEGRGYVLRRIIRRALRHGHELGVTEPFFHQLVGPLAREMGDAYPELEAARSHVERVLLIEEQRFAETLAQGMRILEEALSAAGSAVLPGDLVFRLYDTYGFPADLTADVARARGVSIDEAGFEQAMAAQRARARAASRFSVHAGASPDLDLSSEFCGYQHLVSEARVSGLLREGVAVDRLAAGESGGVILDRTPFYAESGGQVGDRGQLEASGLRFIVEDTQKAGDAHLHAGRLESGELAVGDRVVARVDASTREATMLNHSATHLLHAALREVLGVHVVQKGSLVSADRLRFDFSHFQAVTLEELDRIEQRVNQEIRANAEARTRTMSYEDAVAAGAVALFGEKYGDEVRVLSLGDFSTELCGGTHVRRAGDIGLFRIIGESGIAAGIRRIEAVTGERALAEVRQAGQALESLASMLRTSPAELEGRMRQLLEQSRSLERELQQLKARLASGAGGRDLASEASEVAGIRLLASRLDDDTDARTLRETVDRMKDRLGSGIVLLGCATSDGKVRLAAGVTSDLTGRIRAGELIAEVARGVGGRGGGRADFAQAGGTEPAALDQALAGVAQLVGQRLA
ncbi:MAG: alanine--tRNA ligase [Chromatiales bacterium]|nr:alanine--tRNA ligase [Chromatiales bacterium]